MRAKLLLVIASFLIVPFCFGQNGKDSVIVDTTISDYDALFSELDALIDSLTAPRSFTLFNLSMGTGFFTYQNKSSSITQSKRRFTYAPSIGYYNKSGFGIGVGSAIVNDGTKMNPYQFSVTGSFDYQNNNAFVAGAALTHFFTKKDLSFYTSPLQNEGDVYFIYRKLWFKPLVGFSYGWGSREAFEEREEQIQNIQLTKNGFTRINTKESIVDLNVTTSIRHDFYILDVASKNDYLRITPQISFVSGTQQFGFNQTSNTYATVRRTGRNVLYSTENISLDNRLYFQPISLTTYLKTEYAKGHFFVQPQLMLDYYFPADENNFTTSFMINAGFVF